MAARVPSALDTSGSVTLSFNKQPIQFPRFTISHEDFATSVLKVRSLLTGVDESDNAQRFVCRMYYLLGWFVGDFAKYPSSERLMTTSVGLELTKHHPENEELGEYVMGCLRELGIKMHRGPDQGTQNSPYGAYSWFGSVSPILGWFHTACLGMQWKERTSYDQIRMDWILSVPREYRLWFLRGLADSDGDVHFKDKAVDITTEPNTRFVKMLLNSLGCPATISFYKSASRVTITVSEAMELRIFNPEVLTHRRKILEKLAGASTFMWHWPRWLDEKVRRLQEAGMNPREVCERILEEDNVFMKLHTLKAKQKRNSARADSKSAGGGIPALLPAIRARGDRGP